MKKLIAVFVFVMGVAGAANAQKIGYINTEELVSVMPEFIQVNKELGEYQDLLQKQGMEKAKDLQDADSAFIADSLKMTDKMKEVVKKSLLEKYQEVSGWQQFMDNELQKMGQAKMQPVREKAFAAIKAVAKSSGYAYVLEITSILVGPDGDNILPLVKKQLGIKDIPAQPAGSGAGNGKPRQ